MSAFANAIFANPASSPSLKKEPIEGNSLIQFIRSMNNWGGDTGMKAFGQGQNVFGSGVGKLESSFDATRSPMQMWSRILSGERGTPTQALAPEISQINEGFNTATGTAAELMPRTGGRSTMLSQLPFQKASMIANLLARSRPEAAASIMSGAGIQAQIAQALAAAGLNESQIAQALLNMVTQSQLSVRGQDVQETGQNKALAGSLAGSLLTPFAGLGADALGAKLYKPGG